MKTPLEVISYKPLKDLKGSYGLNNNSYTYGVRRNFKGSISIKFYPLFVGNSLLTASAGGNVEGSLKGLNKGSCLKANKLNKVGSKKA